MIKLASVFLLGHIKHKKDFSNNKKMSEVGNDEKIGENNFPFDINLIKQMTYIGKAITQIPLLMRKAM